MVNSCGDKEYPATNKKLINDVDEIKSNYPE